MHPTRIGSAIAIAVAVVALAGATAHAATSVHATADRTTVGSDDTFEVDVAVDDAHDPRLVVPSSRDFRVIAQSRATEMSIVNGGSPATTERFVLTVQPLRTGTLTFPSLSVVDNGRAATTQPLEVHVIPGHAPTPPRAATNDPFAGFGFGGGDPFGDDDDLADMMRRMQSRLQPSIGKDDVLVRATVDDAHPYVGQQTTLSIHLLTRVPLAGVQLTRMPSVAGATARDLPTPKQPTPRLVTVGGARYQSVLVARKALFPIHAGAIDVPPIEAVVEAGGWGSGAQTTITSPPVRLTARALPPGGSDVEAVGQWSLRATATPEHATAGEPVTLRVVVDGTGELEALQPPAPVVPAGWRGYAPSTHDTPRVDGTRVGGTRTVETVVVPDRAGRFVVEVPPLAYFDPTLARHEQARTAPIVLDIAPRAAVAAAEPSPPTATTTTTTTTVRSPRARLLRIGVSAGALVLAAALVLLLTAFARHRHCRAPSPRAHLRRARRHLQLAARLRSRGRYDQLYDELARALRHTVAALAPDAAEAVPLRDRLAAAPAATRDAIFAAVDACDAGRFAPRGHGDAAVAAACTLTAAAVAAAERSPARRAAARSSLA